MSLAPMPNHNRTGDPAWKALFDLYEPLITPLRRRGLVTDVDNRGATTVIYADLPDGSHLTIGTENGLPSSFDAVSDWTVTRDSVGNPTIHTLVYDSSPYGDHADAGALLAPLLVAIDAHLTALGNLTMPITHPAVVTSPPSTSTAPPGTRPPPSSPNAPRPLSSTTPSSRPPPTAA